MVVAVVVVLGACTGISIGAVRLVGAVDDASADGRDRVRVDDACRALEVRLNRVAPPGSAPGPRQRAVAIRNENAAVNRSSTNCTGSPNATGTSPTTAR